MTCQRVKQTPTDITIQGPLRCPNRDVPQGSFLGPTLVLMFLNDLHLYVKHCDSGYYADDATVHTHGSAPNVIESKLQQDGNDTKLWCKQNKMVINYDKTTCMIVGTQHRTKTFYL